MTDIVAGHVDTMFDTITTSLAIAFAKPDQVVRRCQSAAQRGVPDVPGDRGELSGLSVDNLVRSGRAAEHAMRWRTDQSRCRRNLLRRPDVSGRLREMQNGAGRKHPAPRRAQFFAEEAALWARSSTMRRHDT